MPLYYVLGFPFEQNDVLCKTLQSLIGEEPQANEILADFKGHLLLGMSSHNFFIAHKSPIIKSLNYIKFLNLSCLFAIEEIKNVKNLYSAIALYGRVESGSTWCVPQYGLRGFGGPDNVDQLSNEIKILTSSMGFLFTDIVSTDVYSYKRYEEILLVDRPISNEILKIENIRFAPIKMMSTPKDIFDYILNKA